MKRSKIAIIGVGTVGSTIAYTLLMKNSAAEIILVDTNALRCQGETLDLADSRSFSHASIIYQGSYQDAKKADIIIIAAGKAQKPGESRAALLETNIAILKTIMKGLEGGNPDALIIIVSNPLDTLTFYAQEWSELPRSHIFGTGTFLDSQRLKQYISSFTKIGIDSIEGFVLGEHGDSQIVAWSTTHIAGAPVESFGISENTKQDIARVVQAEAYEIIRTKGATYYGIASCVAELCAMLIFDTKQIVPVSWYHEQYKTCLSLPVVLGKSGVEGVITLDYSKEEAEGLEQSAMLLRERAAQFLSYAQEAS